MRCLSLWIKFEYILRPCFPKVTAPRARRRTCARRHTCAHARMRGTWTYVYHVCHVHVVSQVVNEVYDALPPDSPLDSEQPESSSGSSRLEARVPRAAHITCTHVPLTRETTPHTHFHTRIRAPHAHLGFAKIVSADPFSFFRLAPFTNVAMMLKVKA